MSEKPSFSLALKNSLIEVKEALPKDFNIERFVQNGVALLNGNEQLINYAKQYGTDNIKAGMMKASYLGLDFLSKEAYLIPYKNELNFMIDYRGATKLCKKYSIRPIKDIYAKVVREGDEFYEEIIDGESKVTFKPKPFNNAQIIGAFAVCLFQDGGMLTESMSIQDLNVTKSKSKAQNSMAWRDFSSEMYRKTVLHRLCKLIELDFDSVKQRQLFDEDVAIETDPKKLSEIEIEQSANTEVFVEADVN